MESAKLDQKLNELKQHLEEISIEEFEENLESCGLGIIKKCEEDFVVIKEN